MFQLIAILLCDVAALIIFGAAFARIEKNEDLREQVARDRNDRWHTNKAWALGFLFVANAFPVFELDWSTAIFVIAQLALVIIIFNPSINLNKGNPFLYLSDEGFEGWAKKYVGELGYYLIAVAIFIVAMGWILIKEQY